MEHKGYSAVGVLIGSQVIGRMGLDAARELSHFGLTLEQLRASRVGMPALLEERWHRHIGAKLGDEAFALHVGEQVLLEDMGLYGLFVASQATVRGALDVLCAGTATFSDFRAQLRVEGRWARLEWQALNPMLWTVSMAEHRARFMVKFLRDTAAGPPLLGEVWHLHPAPPYAAEIERSHGLPVRFGQPVDALVFDAALLDCPLKTSNAQMAHSLGQATAALSLPPVCFRLSDRVRHAVSTLLPDGTCSLTAVARALNVPPNVLKYELAKEGTTFREILDGFRRALVFQRLLGIPGMTVERMAVELGFQAPRQFYRRFKEWTGTTVAQYKQVNAQAPN